MCSPWRLVAPLCSCLTFALVATLLIIAVTRGPSMLKAEATGLVADLVPDFTGRMQAGVRTALADPELAQEAADAVVQAAMAQLLAGTVIADATKTVAMGAAEDQAPIVPCIGNSDICGAVGGSCGLFDSCARDRTTESCRAFMWSTTPICNEITASADKCASLDPYHSSLCTEIVSVCPHRFNCITNRTACSVYGQWVYSMCSDW